MFTLHPETVWEGITTLHQMTDDADESHESLNPDLIERCTEVIRQEIRQRNLPLDPYGPDYTLRGETQRALWKLLPELRLSGQRGQSMSN
jgi:hypothetical protein